MESQNKKGFSLVEMLVYVALLSLISLTVIEGVLSITRMSSQFVIARDINNSGRIAMEQMVRKIRFANNVDVAQSIFNNADGKIQFSALDELGNPEVVEFYIDSGKVKMEVDDVGVGYITSKNVVIDELTFFYVANAETESVKIILGITGQKGIQQKSVVFYNTVLLRGGY